MNIIRLNFKPILFFLFYVCILILPTLGCFNLFDWDEINFAESSREMLVSSNFSQVMINFEPFHEKPPLFFWLQVLSMKIFGIGSFAARFPNALLCIILPVVIYDIGRRLKNSTFGWIWSIIFISGFLPNLYFRTGIIDPIFNLFIFLSIYFFYKYFNSLKLNNILFSGLFSGLAILTKGPAGLLIVLITVLIYFVLLRKNISFKHILSFIIIVVLVSSPWYLLELINKGPWFIVEFIKYQLELFSKPVAGHSQPLYYHFLVVLIGCFPFSFLGLKNTFRDSGFGLDFEKMMRILLWVVLILFTIVTTKIAHYSSMAYLPLSFLASIELYKIYNGKNFNRVLKYSLLIAGSFIGLILMSSLFIIINHKDLILTIVKDSNIQYLLENEIQWLGWEWLIPVLIIIGTLFLCLFLNSRLIPSLVLYSIVMGLNFSLLCKFVVPNVENVIQGSAVSFYENISSEKKYLTTVGFKSYAHYFYSKIDLLDSNDSLYNAKKNILKTNFNSLSLNELSSEDKTRFNNYVLSWYINGNIDRPVYFATKKNKINQQLEAAKNLIVIKDFGGFKFYKRELK